MQTIEQSKEMAKLACEALADKKGEDIRVLTLQESLCLQIILLLQTEPMRAR